MKLNRIAVLPLIICSFMLASCPNKEGSQPGFKSSKETASTSIDATVNQTLYSLTVIDDEYSIIRGPFRPTTDMEVVEYDFPYNAWVIFVLRKLTNASYVVKLNGEILESYQENIEGYYYQFYMPAQDSVLNISIHSV